MKEVRKTKEGKVLDGHHLTATTMSRKKRLILIETPTKHMSTILNLVYDLGGRGQIIDFL